GFRNVLLLKFGTAFQCCLQDSTAALRLMYRFRRHYSEAPMIYNSFVSRHLVERVYDSGHDYFVGSMPDVVSGAVNLHFSRQFLRCNRPLSLSGVSRHSTGHKFMSGDSDLQREADGSAFAKVQIHPTMVQSYNIALALGNEL